MLCIAGYAEAFILQEENICTLFHREYGVITGCLLFFLTKAVHDYCFTNIY